MRVLIINCSSPYYNLGARKLYDWLHTQGHAVSWHEGDPGLFVYGYDLVCLSVIFSWDAPLARSVALRVKRHTEVWCGGPGMFALTHWWKTETGLPCQQGLDERFERQRGRYRMTFASRGCPVNCSFSVTANTYIHTRNGWETITSVMRRLSTPQVRYINDIAVVIYPMGERVATPHGSAVATDLLDEGIKPVYTITLRNGLRLTATGEHPLLCVDGEELIWKPVSDISANDIVALRCPDTVPSSYVPLGAPNLSAWSQERCNPDCHLPSQLDEALGWLIGFLIGDGCIPLDERPAVHFALTPSTKDHVQRVVRDTFGLDLHVHKATNTKHMEHGWLYSRQVQAFFTQIIGIDPADKLCVPRCIFASPRPVIQAFIEGLFDADGHNRQGRHITYLTTVSRRLADEVALLILSLGEFPQIHVVRNQGYVHGVYYRVSRKRKDFVPSTRALYKSEKSGQWYWRTQRAAERRFLDRRTLKKSGLHHPLDKPGWFYTAIASITPAGTERVYDLTVPDEHAFIANGIVAHNCIVPRLEGLTFTLDWEFVPAPILCDNNLSALPVHFQQHIIQRYADTHTPLLDANSGFEPCTFDADCYHRWQPILRGPWRFAFDTLSEEAEVKRMMHMLREERAKRKQVYVLIGNEPIAACYERACKVLEWGGEPFCQPFIPLNALNRKHLKIAHDWTAQLLKDFARYFNRHLWRSVSLRAYTNRKGHPPPFAALTLPCDSAPCRKR